MFKSFMKDSALYAFPSFISAGLSFLLIPLYTRVLSPADYGSLDLLLVFANLVNLTIALEVSQGIARFYQSSADEKVKVLYASSGFWFTFVCYTLFLSVALVYAQTLSPLVMGREGLLQAFQVGIAYIWLNGMFYLVQNQFRWELKSGKYAIVSILMSVVTALLAVYFTYVMHWGILGLLMGMCGGVTAGLLLGFYFLRHTFQLTWCSEKLKEMLVFSSPLVLSGLAVIVSTYIDRLMINHFLSIHDVGLYGIAVRVATIVGLLVVGFRAAFVPLVYKHYEKSDTPKQMERIFRYFVMFSLVIFLILTMFAKDILVLLTTPDYYAAASVVSFLVLAFLLSQMYFFASGIGIAKKTHYLIWINLIGAVVNTLLNYFFIPVWGIVGASVATMITYICVFSLYMYLSQKHYYVPYQWKNMSLVVVSFIVLLWLLPLEALNVVERFIVALLLLIVLLVSSFVAKLITFGEIRQLKNGVLALWRYRARS